MHYLKNIIISAVITSLVSSNAGSAIFLFERGQTVDCGKHSKIYINAVSESQLLTQNSSDTILQIGKLDDEATPPENLKLNSSEFFTLKIARGYLEGSDVLPSHTQLVQLWDETSPEENWPVYLESKFPTSNNLTKNWNCATAVSAWERGTDPHFRHVISC